jgi:crossover junction endodeoxyribonuclease RuvC
MKILGIDPGLAKVGYGIIDYSEKECKSLDYGVIKTASNESLGRRLEKIFAAIKKLVEQFQPEAVALEQIFFAANLKTAVQVAQARGVIILATNQIGLSLHEYTPLQIKLAITGYGRAEKERMQKMVRGILHLADARIPDDAADALAAAICHAHSLKYKSLGVPLKRKRQRRRKYKRQ